MKKTEKIDLMNPKYWRNPKTRKRYSYFRRDGRGYENVLDYAKDMEPRVDPITKEKIDLRRVAETTTRFGFWVSTVWLGIDYQFAPLNPPLIFETMVFRKGLSEFDMNRYTTEEQAIAGHAEMVKNWNNPIYVIRKIIDRKTWGIQYSIRKFFIGLKRKIFYGR